METKIILTETCYEHIRNQLFPPDDSKEHFGFGITGISRCHHICNILLRIFIYADKSCLETQSGGNVRPKREFIQYVWIMAKKSNGSLIDFHTHPFSDANVGFSGIDDNSEYESFPQAVKYLGDGPHASVVLGKNSMDARWYDPTTKILKPVTAVRILGDRMVTIRPTSRL
ncbi:hypothetical protein ACFL5Z_12905 [Planctomycetota bacterium]